MITKGYTAKNKRGRRLGAVLLIGLLAVILLQTPLSQFGSVLRPFDTVFRAIERGAGHTLSWVRDRTSGFESVRRERDLAREERDRALAELMWLRATVPDFELLHSLREAQKKERISAGVLSVPNESPYDSLIIDRGVRDGIVKGAVVYGTNGEALGSIVGTTERTSVVMLFTSPGVTSLLYAPRENVFVRGTGMGGGFLTARMPHGSSVHVGDPIIMPTLAGSVIGTVERVWSDPAEPGVLAAVGTTMSLQSMRMVAVDTAPFTIPSPSEVRDMLTLYATNTPFTTLPEGMSTSTGSSTPL